MTGPAVRVYGGADAWSQHSHRASRRNPSRGQPRWLVVVALFTWAPGRSYFPEVIHGISPAGSYSLGLLSIQLLFASVLARESRLVLPAVRHGLANGRGLRPTTVARAASCGCRGPSSTLG
jgi:hypothetical protein